jgi:hypothetical protein
MLQFNLKYLLYTHKVQSIYPSRAWLTVIRQRRPMHLNSLKSWHLSHTIARKIDDNASDEMSFQSKHAQRNLLS